MNTDSQWSKQEACFARATRVWLAITHNTCVPYGECVRCSKRIARANELDSCQSNLCNSRGYEGLQKSKDSLKDCFENVNIYTCNAVYCSSNEQNETTKTDVPNEAQIKVKDVTIPSSMKIIRQCQCFIFEEVLNLYMNKM